MPAALHPEDLLEAFGAAFNAGDVDTVAALCVEGAAYEPQPGRAVTGPGIRAAVAESLAAPPRIEQTLRKALVSDDTALLVSDWAVTSARADGAPTMVRGTMADVARRGGGGVWRLLIYDPFGTAAAA